MKDLNEIMVFARVAQLGSFSRAAIALDMPVSTVSRKVSDLEARLGITLIQRTTRKLSMTSSGQKYYEQCADLLRGIDEAEVQITQSQVQPEGFLRVSVPTGMASGGFMDLISRFLNQYPRIDVDILVTNQFVDLVSENVDLAIRFGELSDSTLVAKRLGISSRSLVAAPAYLKKHGHPKQPQDLRKHNCIIYRSRSDASVWELTKDRGRQRVKVSGRLTASDMAALKSLAIRGHGIAHLPEMYTADELSSGNLRLVLPDWRSSATPVHAVYPNRRFVPVRLAVFLKTLEAWDSPAWTR